MTERAINESLLTELVSELERKMLSKLSEVENLRNTVQILMDENTALKLEKEVNIKKVEELISLLNMVNLYDHTQSNTTSPIMQSVKPVLVGVGE